MLFEPVQQGNWRSPSIPGRWHESIYHQAQLIFPTIDRVARDGLDHAAAVIATLELKNWTRQVLRVALPGVPVVLPQQEDKRLVVPQACLSSLVQMPVAETCVGYFSSPVAPDRLRMALAQHCGFTVPRKCHAGEKPRIVFVDRHMERHIVDAHSVVATVQAAFPNATVVYRMTSDGMAFCHQLELLTGGDVYVLPHGQHMTNLVIMPRDTAVVELMPWTMGDYCGYPGMGHHVGLRHRQIESARPAFTVKSFRQGKYTKEQCRAAKQCYLPTKRTNLHVRAEDIVAAINAMGGPRLLCQA